MTTERPRGSGTREEVQQMLIETGEFFRDSSEYPDDGPYMYGEGGILVWKLLHHLEDIYPFNPLTYFAEPVPHERFGLTDILGFTQGLSLNEDKFLIDVINRRAGEGRNIWVNEIGRSRDTPIAPEGTPIFLIQEENRFTVVRRGAEQELRLEDLRLQPDYKYIYRGEQWMAPVLDGRFAGTTPITRSITENEGLYWDFDWTRSIRMHAPMQFSGPQIYAAQSQRRLFSSGRDMTVTSVYQVQHPNNRYVWGYAPIEDVTMIDYARMHLLTNRCRVIGLMDTFPIGKRDIAKDVSQTVYALSPTDTEEPDRYISLVEFLQSAGWIS